jgi:hypothetical protein
MAKRGLVFYFVMSFGFTIIGGLFYLHFKYSPPLKEHPFDTYKKLEEKEVILTDLQIRRQAERVLHDQVPEADSKDGYM